MQLTGKYGVFDVEYGEMSELFSGKLNGETVSQSKSLQSLIKALDRFGEKEKKSNPVQAIMIEGWRGKTFVKVTVTSVTDEGECWIKDSEGKRTKTYKSASIYKDTPDNQAKADEIKKLWKEIEELESKQDAIFASMEKVVKE